MAAIRAALALLGFLAPCMAHALTITQFVTVLSPNLATSGAATTSFAPFAASSGTLDSVSFNFVVNGNNIALSMTGSLPLTNNLYAITYSLLDPLAQTRLAYAQSLYLSPGTKITALNPDPNPNTSLFQYIGTGSLALQFAATKSGAADTIRASGTPQIGITYNYTAATTPVPEPAAPGALAAGLGLLAALHLRRRNRNRAPTPA